MVATKILAFAIGAFIAGLGGSLLGYRQGTVTFDSFDVLLGLGAVRHRLPRRHHLGVRRRPRGLARGQRHPVLRLDEWFSLELAWYQVITGVGSS